MLLFLIFIVGGSGFFTGEIDIDIDRNSIVHFSGYYGFRGDGRVPVMMYLPEGAESLSVLVEHKPIRFLPFRKSGIRFFLTLDNYREFRLNFVVNCEDGQFTYQLAPFKGFSGEIEFLKIELAFPNEFTLQSSLSPTEVLRDEQRTRICILLEDFTPSLPLQLEWKKKD